jgi:hypothetical protein
MMDLNLQQQVEELALITVVLNIGDIKKFNLLLFKNQPTTQKQPIILMQNKLPNHLFGLDLIHLIEVVIARVHHTRELIMMKVVMDVVHYSNGYGVFLFGF